MYRHRHALLFLSLASCTSSQGCEPTHATSVKVPDFPIHELFVQRRSRYSLKRRLSSQKMAEQLKHLFEAARWAPSSYNSQPWRFFYGIQGTPAWNTILSTLVPYNKEWAQHAGALIVVTSKKNFEHNGEFSRTYAFDAGLAAAQLMLEATNRGLIAHGMSGFDHEDARKKLQVPTDCEVLAIIAIGEATRPGDAATKEFLEREKKPQTRKKIAEFAFEGPFPTKK